MKSRMVMMLALALAMSFTFACTQQSSTNQPPAAAPTDSNQTAANQPPAQAEPQPAEQPRTSASKPAAAKPMSKNEGKPVADAKPAAPAPLVVPSGTVITIRMGSAVGSKISSAGDVFNGTVAEDISEGGEVAIPAGSAVSGTVTDAKPLGRFAGGASIALTLHSVNVNGRSYNITTSSFAEAAKGKGKRTGVMAGGGAALGAIIGGIAGGGKGAAIGALAGGGAGTAGAAFTGNKDIVVPAEKALAFKLGSDLTIKR